MPRALLIIDVQNDFCEGGSLGVAGGAELARTISRRIPEFKADLVVATRDRHIDPAGHFADDPDFADTWPPHCVVGTTGVELHPDLDRSAITAVFDKGEYAAAYSGFEARTYSEADPDGVLLADWLRARHVETVDVVGIATDYCVRATAVDGANAGFDVTVHLDLTAAVTPETGEQAVAAMKSAGVRVS